MKVKKFTAKSMPDAMKSIRNELGNEAIILNSRIVYTGGILGFFRKKSFEIIAAVDQLAKHDPKPIR
ncbi:MAG: flagellar biosynthesis protein FlhF, partial [Bacillota bacterium]|nr:flagellar biosynthesis protein FlhF [Bacillota bacterium]